MGMLWKCRTGIHRNMHLYGGNRAIYKESHLDIWGISAIFVSERLNVSDILERL